MVAVDRRVGDAGYGALEPQEGDEVDKWIAVVTDPLGLVGFVLFLIFSLLATKRRSSHTTGLTAGFIILAAIALFGSLGLAYLRHRHLSDQLPPARSAAPLSDPQPPSVPKAVVPVAPSAARDRVDPSQPPTPVQQETHGSHSPAVGAVKGNVTITIQGSPPPTTNAEQPLAPER
jgi:hypothetical protein